MTERDRLLFWRLTLAAAAIVGVVAGLLLAIIATARSILGNAGRALDTADEIVSTTRPIWQLEQTNVAASQLLATARAIEQHATEVADALEG